MNVLTTILALIAYVAGELPQLLHEAMTVWQNFHTASSVDPNQVAQTAGNVAGEAVKLYNTVEEQIAATAKEVSSLHPGVSTEQAHAMAAMGVQVANNKKKAG